MVLSMNNQKVQLKINRAKLFPNPNLAGIDTKNIIAKKGNDTYTAVEDCIAFITCKKNGEVVVTFDGSFVSESTYGVSQTVFYTPIFMKKGQTISITGGAGTKIWVYGILY